MSHRLKYGEEKKTGNGDVTQLVAIDNGVQRSNAVTSFRDGSCNTTVNLHSRSRCYDICVNACRRRRRVAGVCRIARAVIASGERERVWWCKEKNGGGGMGGVLVELEWSIRGVCVCIGMMQPCDELPGVRCPLLTHTQEVAHKHRICGTGGPRDQGLGANLLCFTSLPQYPE